MRQKTLSAANRAAMVVLMVLFATAFCAALLPAQGTVRVQNLAPLERAGWVTATVPLEDGQLEAKLEVRTQPASWAILGAKASPRTRYLHLLAKLDAYETRDFRYELGPPAGEEPAPRVEGDDPVPAPPAPMLTPPELLVEVDGEETITRLDAQLELVENAGRVVLRSRARLPGTMLVAEAWWYLYPGARVIPWELLVVCSDPTTKAMRQDLERLELRMPRSVVPLVRNAVAHGAGQPRLENGYWSILLLGPTHFADAQGQAWSGVLLLPDGATPDEARSLAAELHGPMLAMARPEDWKRSGAWGPWGVLPTAHPAAERTFDAALQRHLEWARWAAVPRDPWDEAWLQVKRPGQTGDQYDFGVTKLAPALAANGGAPVHLDEAYFRAIKTACRRGYYREADGSPVLQETHPNLVFWGQQVHYHPGVSPDQLGKDPWVQQPDGHGWTGWDNEHISINGLCGSYLLTGSHLLSELVRSNVESWLLGATTKPGWSTTGRGAPRSVGRTLLAMAWCYECTGDPRIPQRMRERLSSSFADLLEADSELVVLGVHAPDGRKLKGRHRFWMPCQEALGVVGLDAAHRTTGDARFLTIAKRIARTLILYGWWERSPGDWTVGDAIAVLEDGQPLPASAYSDESLVKDHSGTDFDLWALPAVKLALSYAKADGDEMLVARCGSILSCLWARRVENPACFDRYASWGL